MGGGIPCCGHLGSRRPEEFERAEVDLGSDLRVEEAGRLLAVAPLEVVDQPVRPVYVDSGSPPRPEEELEEPCARAKAFPCIGVTDRVDKGVVTAHRAVGLLHGEGDGNTRSRGPESILQCPTDAPRWPELRIKWRLDPKGQADTPQTAVALDHEPAPRDAEKGFTRTRVPAAMRPSISVARISQS